MIRKKVINPNRVRRINGGFSFIPHRFLSDGFLASLSQKELLLYLFLILVSDRNGLSFYSYDSICSLLQITADQYIDARNALIKKDLIAFEGTVFQILDLPKKPIKISAPQKETLTVEKLIQQSIKEIDGGR
ncbi:MAG: helix-turn-helix domain-containing protein [Deltaproteobacteria bacterium]|nr:helix-turn-helix domain-containing protein [Deltaproteobacteria bacterium]